MLKGQRKVKNVGRAVGSTSGVSLLLLAFLLVNPLVGSSASALEVSGDEVDSAEAGELVAQAETDEGRVEISFTPTTVSGEMAPTTEAGLKKQLEATATVTIQNAEDYTIYIGAKTTGLVGVNSGEVIDSVKSATSYEDLTANSWGIYYGEGTSVPTNATYLPVETSRGTQIETGGRTTSTLTKTYALGFAANINNQVPADTYENEITLSVVSSPLEITNAFGIETMQEMTAAICTNVDVGTTDRLKDARDGKLYWVAKLSDNNCWMTQNLDLDLSTSVALTPEDSDVAANWTPGYDTTAQLNGWYSEGNSSKNIETRSWKQGAYVLSTPADGTNCANNVSGQGLSNCSKAGFIDVTGWTASTNSEFTSEHDGHAVDEATKTYDAHYLVGNWYQWNAATAGSGGTIVSTNKTEAGMVNAESSICPKNWRLPTSGGVDSTKTFNQEDSFGWLLQQYGWNGTSTVAGSINSTVLVASPLFFVRSGYVSNSGYLTNSGAHALYWSSTASTTSSYAYYFLIGVGSNVAPSESSYPRYRGHSVRCVAR